MQISVQAAEANLAELIQAAQRGEDIVIADGARGLVRLVPIPARTPFKIGIWKDKALGPGPDFLEPMSEDDLALWEGGS